VGKPDATESTKKKAPHGTIKRKRLEVAPKDAKEPVVGGGKGFG